mmetsp:Transcript_12679/g.37348  ORF Transcript_12679/g.37348 Transcript_12679/m.37348 type:complete len:614 (-) Transcript_12679:89-1930(-)
MGPNGSTSIALIIAAPVAIAACASAFLKRKRRHYPNYDELDKADTIKVGGSPQRLKDFAAKPIDFIIVGSGLGGLTSASLLSKAGYRVLCLEQHDVAGGSTHTFEDGPPGNKEDYSFDVGVHYLGENLAEEGFFRKTAVRRIFDVVSDGKLEWSSCSSDYDHAVNLLTGVEIAMPSNDVNEKLRRLAAAFPGSEAALKRYRRACQVARVVSGLSLCIFKLLPEKWNRIVAYPLLRGFYDRYAGRSAREVMEKCGLSLEAIGGCTYNYGDFGLPASRGTFLSQALLETHYDSGGYFPRGGSASIAKTIVAAIQRRGGAVMVRAPVSEIVVEDVEGYGRKRYRATGVKCRGVMLRSRYGVISNAGAFNTYERLLPEASAVPARQSLRLHGAFEPSVQMVYLFVGLDASDEELNLPASNFWLLHGWDHDGNWEKFERADRYDDLGYLPAVFLSFGSAKDDDCRKRGAKAALQVLAPVRYEWFKQWKESKVKHRGPAYENFKKEWTERLLQHLYDQFPQCKGRVAFSDLATPLTTNFYLNSLRGENYGLAHTLERFSAEVQAEALHTAGPPNIDGLYLVGQDATCVGVVSALASGFLTSAYLSKAAFARGAAEMMLG